MSWMFLLVIPLLGTSIPRWILYIASVAAFYYASIRKKQSHWERKGIKYLEPKFLVGNIEVFRTKSFADNMREIYRAFPEERYHGFYQMTSPNLVVKDADLIKQITVKEFDHFLNHRHSVDEDVDPFWGKNLFASRDERWRDLRSTLSPSFTSSKMKIMFSLIDEAAQQFVEYFQNQPGQVLELEMKDTFSRYTNDVIASAAFGLKIDSLKDRTNDFYVFGKQVSDFGGLKVLKFFASGISPTLTKLFQIKIISPKFANFFSKIIEDTVNVRKEKNIVRPDMIHLMMEAQKGRQQKEEELKVDEGFSTVTESDLTKNKRKQEITLDDIVSQAFVFFLAGFETVSTLLSFVFYELALNPEIQDRLREEIQSVEGEITYEALLKLKYLDMVLSEALRKWPPAVATDREVSKDFVIQPVKPGEKPLLLEKGSVVSIPVQSIHNDPKFYPNPEKFDPERFSEENKHKINTAVYIPFGSGPRNCIGSRFALLESKISIFRILRHFEVVRIDKTPVPIVFSKININIEPEGGMWLGLKKLS